MVSPPLLVVAVVVNQVLPKIMVNHHESIGDGITEWQQGRLEQIKQ